ncbi:DUF4259 domain-containing protein [Paludisphaera mucosa]|uniref:DUF4259 domain-containing protein n=1 Tax=Paludisphaera mucosa TaxID=3030827 RepID=A0ABT6FI50_9BACT|nr:DUF4259 domain-containing protein [Paludisphaera mucosa]MDG3007245.1 DUF4259 domain-containing protein [Paludisphaera mucosa]
MGAWGHGGFENDDAADFVADLLADPTWKPVAEALNTVLDAEDDWLEAPTASVAIAAAEVVAIALGRPAAELPDGLPDWISRREAPEPKLVEKARLAIERILQDSELKDLWEETPDSAAWHEEMESLSRRVSGAGS